MAIKGRQVQDGGFDTLDALSCIERFKGKRIVVLGEGILDTYLYGEPKQLCREAPVPVVDLKNSRVVPGGAGNTAMNVAGLGAEVFFVSALGRDDAGRKLSGILNAGGVNTGHVILDSRRKTLQKQRLIAGRQMLLRLDEGSTEPVRKVIRGELLSRLRRLFLSSDALMISDYRAGLMTSDLIREIFRSRWGGQHLTALDSKIFSVYSGIGLDLAKPNYFEAVSFLGLPALEGDARVRQMIEAGPALLKRSGARIAAVTLDKDGALVFEKDSRPYRIYAPYVQKPNTAGAGDAFISAFVLALCAKAEVSLAAEIASLASSVAVGKNDATGKCAYSELKGRLSLGSKNISGPEDLASLSHYYHSQGRRIVFTNGCFDILHRGHIHFLNDCKALGDILFVALNSDDSIRLVKGPNRPINRLKDRVQIISSLSCVDHVMDFEGDAPLHIIETLRPDVFVKGANHDLNRLKEAFLVKQLGGETLTLPYLKEYSTGQILQKGLVGLEKTSSEQRVGSKQ